MLEQNVKYETIYLIVKLQRRFQPKEIYFGCTMLYPPFILQNKYNWGVMKTSVKWTSTGVDSVDRRPGRKPQWSTSTR